MQKVHFDSLHHVGIYAGITHTQTQHVHKRTVQTGKYRFSHQLVEVGWSGYSLNAVEYQIQINHYLDHNL